MDKVISKVTIIANEIVMVIIIYKVSFKLNSLAVRDAEQIVNEIVEKLDHY